MQFSSAIPDLWTHALTATREGGAPLVVLALVLVGVVTLDAVGRGVVGVVRRLIGGLRDHS